VKGSWGTAIEVPGLGALNKDTGYGAQVTSVSCASTGNCAAGALPAPGAAACAATPGATALSHMTAADTARTAGTWEPIGSGFVALERNGRWGKATGVPGLAALNTGGDSGVYSVSCTPARTCAAGGYYSDRDANSEGFVVVEKNGTSPPAAGRPAAGRTYPANRPGFSRRSGPSTPGPECGPGPHPGGIS
jgi:hypothetical protein